MLFVKKVTWSVLRQLHLSAPLALMRSSGLAEEGWYKSYYARQPVDNKGNAIPWYTYPAIHFLEQRLKSAFRVFEYGCGNSTLWYASRVSRVVAVEHDPKWVKIVSPRLPDNALVVHRPLDDTYVREIARHGAFDLVAIDGRMRAECSLVALNNLGDHGVILWDNSDREGYANAINHILAAGFREISFTGMMPIAEYTSRTSILYRDGNCLEI